MTPRVDKVTVVTTGDHYWEISGRSEPGTFTVNVGEEWLTLTFEDLALVAGAMKMIEENNTQGAQQ